MKKIFLFLLLLSCMTAYGQKTDNSNPLRLTGRITLAKGNATDPDSSCLVEMGFDSTKQAYWLHAGFKDSVKHPRRGMIMPNIPDSALYFYTGGAWQKLGSGGGSGSPTGAAGGSLSGSYPNPSIGAGVIMNNNIGSGAAIGYSKLNLAGGILISDFSFTGSPSNLTFLRGDGIWSTPSNVPGGAAGGDLANTYPNPTVTTQAITTAKLADSAVTSIKIRAQQIYPNHIFATNPPTSGQVPSYGAGGAWTWITPSTGAITGMLTPPYIPVATGVGTIGNSNLKDSSNNFIVLDTTTIYGFLRLKNVQAAVNSDMPLVLGNTQGTVRTAAIPTAVSPLAITWPGNQVSISTSGATNGQVLGYNGSGVVWTTASGGTATNLTSDRTGRLPLIWDTIPAMGISASSSMTNYGFGNVDGTYIKINSTGNSGTRGLWSPSNLTGDSIKLKVPKWVIIGNSIAEGHPNDHGQLHAPPGFGMTIGYPDTFGQLSWTLRTLTNMRFVNQGIGGTRLDQIRARFTRDALGQTVAGITTLDSLPYGIILEGGINDVAANRPVALMEADIIWMVSQAQNAGIKNIILMNCPGDTAFTDPNQFKAIDSLNAWESSGVLDQYGVNIFDLNSFWRDPAYNDNRHINRALAADDVHFSRIGYDSLAKVMFRKMKFPVLRRLKFVNEISPDGFAGYSRPANITFDNTAYTITGSTVYIPVTAPLKSDTVYAKILTTTNVTGTTQTGFSHIYLMIDNYDSTIVYTARAPYLPPFAGNVSTYVGNMRIVTTLTHLDTVLASDYTVRINSNITGALAEYLPINFSVGKEVTIINQNPQFVITLNSLGAIISNGITTTSLVMSSYSATLRWDGTNWNVVDGLTTLDNAALTDAVHSLSTNLILRGGLGGTVRTTSGTSTFDTLKNTDFIITSNTTPIGNKTLWLPTTGFTAGSTYIIGNNSKTQTITLNSTTRIGCSACSGGTTYSLGNTTCLLYFDGTNWMVVTSKTALENGITIDANNNITIAQKLNVNGLYSITRTSTKSPDTLSANDNNIIHRTDVVGNTSLYLPLFVNQDIFITNNDSVFNDTLKTVNNFNGQKGFSNTYILKGRAMLHCDGTFWHIITDPSQLNSAINMYNGGTTPTSTWLPTGAFTGVSFATTGNITGAQTDIICVQTAGTGTIKTVNLKPNNISQNLSSLIGVSLSVGSSTVFGFTPSSDTTLHIATTFDITGSPTGQLNINVIYTDRNNNSHTSNIYSTSGIVNFTSAGDYDGQYLTIRVKSGTTITFQTVVTGSVIFDYTADLIK